MSIVLTLFIITALILLVLKQFKRADVIAKPQAVKKSEIIEDYEQLMRDVIANNQEDTDALKVKKMQLLKQISRDLHKNIFFDEQEAKAIVQKLASL